jgi:hypothetical protein
MTDILTRLAALSPSNELLPCPWCNGEATLDRQFNARSGTNYRIICTSKKCSVRPETAYISQAQAISSWNNRPREATLVALVQEAVGEIERFRKEYLLKRGECNSMADKLRQATKRIEELDQPAPGWGAD